MAVEFEIKDVQEDGRVVTLAGTAGGLNTEYWYGKPSEYTLTTPHDITVTETPPTETIDEARTRLVNSVLDFVKYVYDPARECDNTIRESLDAAAVNFVSRLEA